MVKKSIGSDATDRAILDCFIKAKREAERLQNEEKMAGLSATNKATNARDEYFDNKYNNFKTNLVAYGGPVYKHSGDWSNGITFINEGGTHEENPNGGVPVGIDKEGVPNLVEEGEVIWNDYVFSERLKVPKAFKDKYKLKGKDAISFAEAAEKFAEEDKKRKEAVDTRNAADQMVYQSEKTIKDLGDKLGADDKSGLEAKINDLKEALKGENIEDIKAKQKALEEKFYEVSAKVYQQANPNGDPNMGSQPGCDGNCGDCGNHGANGDGYVDADYREVNDN